MLHEALNELVEHKVWTGVISAGALALTALGVFAYVAIGAEQEMQSEADSSPYVG